MGWLILTLVGMVAGTFGSLLGLGGGIILVPALFYLSGSIPGIPEITPQLAIGTSLMLIIITSLASSISYAKQKLIDFSSAWLFFAGSAPGAIIGAWLSKYFDKDSFTLYYGIFMLFMLFLLSYRPRLRGKKEKQWETTKTYTDANGQVHTYGYSKPYAICLALAVGILSSVFGIGGGALLVPFLLVLFRFPPHVAAATSMFVILLSSSVGSVTHVVLGHVAWGAVIATAPGAWIGGKVGSQLSRKLSGQWLERILKVVLLLIAIRMLWQGLK
ncbi:sulfite exporter TauE/SafE family protein [Aneurinibacillus sp. REN35]|uniref:sulfite exporter TauE/SafE family protein n=1 Tax=Aneurinibacillus sp. REN35 TaxID=3237286 RepID=UPI00352909AC